MDAHLMISGNIQQSNDVPVGDAVLPGQLQLFRPGEIHRKGLVDGLINRLDGHSRLFQPAAQPGKAGTVKSPLQLFKKALLVPYWKQQAALHIAHRMGILQNFRSQILYRKPQIMPGEIVVANPPAHRQIPEQRQAIPHVIPQQLEAELHRPVGGLLPVLVLHTNGVKFDLRVAIGQNGKELPNKIHRQLF